MRHHFTVLVAGLLLSGWLQAAEATWPRPIQALEARGARIVGTFEAPGGLTGYAAEYQGEAMAFYLTADGQHALVGTLFDGGGQDLTARPLEQLVYEPMARAMWQRLEDSRWIADGSAEAPRKVYVFTDPNCPYCARFWQAARPWVEAGKVQLRHLLVGILRDDSPGKAAALLGAEDPAEALRTFEQGHPDARLEPMQPIPSAIARQLEAHLQLMEALGGVATPAIFSQDADGRMQFHQGMPEPARLEAVLGPRDF